MTQIKKLSIFFGTALLLLAISTSTINANNPGQVYFNDFDGGVILAPGVTDALGGITNLESVQGYAGSGVGGNVFGGNFLRNTTGGYDSVSGLMGTPGSPTTLTLTGLPPHTSIDLNFLLAIMDSWDGGNGDYGPDILTVSVGGVIVFSETFGFGDPSFVPPPGVLLTEETALGFNAGWLDAAYDMSVNPTFEGIAHTSSTLTIEWVASGDGWQGIDDESWAIDNLEVALDGKVDIDIKPGSDPNSIKLASKGVVPVAILTTGDFDTSTLDPVTVLFAGAAPLRWAVEDVDLDGDLDLLLHFKTRELNLDENDVEAVLIGMTFGGETIIGTDAVHIVP